MSERRRVRKFGRALTGFALLFALAGLTLATSAAAEEAEGVVELTPLTPMPAVGGAEIQLEGAPDLWFVELTNPPTTDGTDPATLAKEKNAFRAAAKKAGVKYTERYAFGTLWNGFSVKASAAAIGSLARLPGVTAVYPVETYTVPETPAVSPDLATAIAMTGADVAQSTLGLSGAGVKVAIMDTGVDYDHADLGGDGAQRTDSSVFPTTRVTHGWDFVGDAFNAFPPSKSYNPTPVPDARPDDCNGHGTHVAGIVGANGAVTGVAPGVTFGAYRVFGCGGSTTADIMIAAMERALTDGMHVLNMSIGSAFNTWNKYPTAWASNQLVKAGMVVVASIGNSGADGVYSAGAPGVGARVIGTASFDNSHVSAPMFIVNPSGREVGYFKLATTVDPPTSGTTPEIVYVGRGCAADPYLADPSGKVALIVRGACTFNEKYQRAVDAGSVAVVIHNNLPGLFAGGGVVDRGVPGVGISLADGQHIRSLASPTLTWTDQMTSSPNPNGGLISSFSSYGLAAELDLKPDIGAPGGLIRSTYPLERGGYATVSGTSMASPHVAGAVALLLEARPGMKPGAVRDALQNTASPRPWWGNPGLGFLDNVHRQGAGMVQIDKAATASAGVSPGKLALGESEAGPATHTLTVSNGGASDVTYTLGHTPALSTGGSTFSPSFFTGFASVSWAQGGVAVTEITVPAGGSASVDATITANPSLADRSQYGGYLTFTPSGGGQALRVPYAGFKGDYQSITVLVPTASNFPRMGRHVDYVDTGADWVQSFAFVPAGGTYTMQTATHAPSGRPIMDIPYVLAHFDHQAEIFRLDAFAADGTALGLAYEQKYLPRNSTATGFFAFAWDGKVKKGKDTWVDVPDGAYKLTVSVLKAGGDKANPAHWEIRELAEFQIDRP